MKAELSHKRILTIVQAPLSVNQKSLIANLPKSHHKWVLRQTKYYQTRI